MIIVSLWSSTSSLCRRQNRKISFSPSQRGCWKHTKKKKREETRRGKAILPIFLAFFFCCCSRFNTLLSLFSFLCWRWRGAKLCEIREPEQTVLARRHKKTSTTFVYCVFVLSFSLTPIGFETSNNVMTSNEWKWKTTFYRIINKLRQKFIIISDVSHTIHNSRNSGHQQFSLDCRFVVEKRAAAAYF